MQYLQIHQSTLIQPLQKLLENVEIRTDFESTKVTLDQLYDSYGEEFEELAEDLSFNLNEILNKGIEFQFALLNLQPTGMNLFFDPEYHFNRYRLKTLRNIFYDGTSNFDLQKWRGYCRSKEKEAHKSGLIETIWNNSLGMKIFGPSEEPGYFGDNGSSGWKLYAIGNFCLDLYCKKHNIQFLRLSPFDSFMVNGQIELLGNSLKLRKNEGAIQKMLSRQIGFSLPDDQKNEKEA